MLFQVGFNQRDLQPFEDLIADDLEFYHDQSGVIMGKEPFLKNTEEGLFALDYLATRELIEGSTKIYPLYDQGKLYGIIQEGAHQFFAKYANKKRTLTSTAKFSHLWIKEGNHWLLKRVLSFDHQAPK